jgi:hypothetical protein
VTLHRNNKPITIKQMDNAINGGYHVIVIINGEYYDYKPIERKKIKRRIENNG